MQMKIIDFDQLPVVMSVNEMAKALGIGMNTAYDLIHSKKVKSVRCGRHIKVPKESLKEFLGIS